MKMNRKGNEDEVKMKMRWKLLNQDAKRGTQKKREEKTPTQWNLAQNGQTLERQGKRKAEANGHGTRPAEEGEDRSAWTNLTRRKPTKTSARNGPNLPGGRRTQGHMKKEEKGTHGDLVQKYMMHPQLMQFPLVRLNGQSSSHNPLDGLRVQPLNYVHNSTSPTTIKERITIPARMSCCL